MATVKRTESQTSEKIHVTGVVADAAPLKVAYTLNIVIVPDTITVRYERHDHGTWEIQRVAISGPRKLKSGEVSEKSRFTGDLRYIDARELASLPEWARTFVTDNMPAAPEGMER